MGAVQTFSLEPVKPVRNSWQWVSVGSGAIALAAAAAAAFTPEAAGWTGLALVAAVAITASLFLYAMWPRAAHGNTDPQRVAEAAAHSSVAWAITSPEGALRECNAAYRRLARTKEGEEPVPPEFALRSEGAASALYRLARSASSGLAHEEILPIDGGEKLAVSVRPLSDGHAAWWFTSGIPPNDRTAAPANPLSHPFGVLQDAPIGIAVVERDGVLTEANWAFSEFFSEHSVCGKQLSELIDPSERPRVTDMLACLDAGTAPTAPIELRPAGQQHRMAELYARSARAGGQFALLYLVDVSEQKSLETRFAQSQKMHAVGQLAGGVAHDFNNLLTVIIGNSEFLLMRHPAGDPSFREINDIHQNAIRAANLVRQLLAFSRQQTMQPRVLDLGVVVGELAEMLRRLLREGVALRLERGDNLRPVHADEAQLSNAIINLVVNARDAMPGGGTVTIRTENETVHHVKAIGSANVPAGDYVRVDVSDTGTGIAPEYLGKIFDPFFTTKPMGEGTGLGLATVYGIVKQTGGFISVRSEVGEGTTFSILLPCYRGEVEARSEPSIPRDVTGQETILLVEDEEAVRSFAARALKQRGYNVIEASGGEQALEIVNSRPGEIHLLITDVVMPNMDGPTLARAVRERRPDTRVIFMSGYAEEAFRRHDTKAEELHFLPKPFGLKQLAAKVKDVLLGTPAP